jgi:hypothetical protein
LAREQISGLEVGIFVIGLAPNPAPQPTQIVHDEVDFLIIAPRHDRGLQPVLRGRVITPMRT